MPCTIGALARCPRRGLEQTLHQRSFCLTTGRRFRRIDARRRRRRHYRYGGTGVRTLDSAGNRGEAKFAEYPPSFCKGEINEDHDELQCVRW